ncbi:HD-GYP domain-containing protein [Mesobacillus zeae]|uniref:HD-GYP domain-containing protein n=1 Tax=Mesobacillus zeae TaxID=1917180 RepID=A0A398BGA5_9BACI|nr:HD-GYP domain-containing protein [Mesobacillus zeae]
MVRVHIDELQEGCILAEDVFSKTSRPIVGKQTVLTKELIDVLKAFVVKEAEVEKTLVTGMPFIPVTVIQEKEKDADKDTDKEELNFVDLFLRAKKSFEKEFFSWQSGLPVDISAIRSLLLPLMDMLEKDSSNIFRLHHFSTNDDYLFHHSLAVGILSGYIARKMNYSKGDTIQVGLAGSLADCGMAKVSSRLLNKRTTLSVEDYEEIKKHPTYSYQMVRNSPLLKDSAKIAIIQHHERLNGSGYPFGEKDARIHAFSKIIAVADAYHAMTSDRTFKSRLSPFRVLEIINEDHFGEFDICAVKALNSALLNYTTGSIVRLSDGQEAEILFVEEKSPARPLVKLSETNTILSLEKNRHLFIEDIIYQAGH